MHASETPSRVSKKRGPLFWILIGVASFVVLIVITFGAIGYFGFRALQQTSGLDIETIKNHPNFAANKMKVTAISDNEIISEDMLANEIHYRSKKTGQEFVSKMDPGTQRFIVIPETPAPGTK